MITNAPDTTDILNPQKTVKLCLTVCYFYHFFSFGCYEICIATSALNLTWSWHS